MTSVKGKLRQRLLPGALILLYHRVNDLRTDPQLLSVKPETFRSHLEIIRRKTQPTAMSKLARGLVESRRFRRAVVVTFDDGYTDNLETAKPLLQEYDVPATVHVSTGYVGGKSEFWWDELERLLLLPGELPQHPCVKVGADELSFDLQDFARYGQAAAAAHEKWDVLQECPTPRHQMYSQLCVALGNVSVPEREEALSDLRALAGQDTVGRSSHLAMSREGVVELAAGGLVEVAAHTVHHPRLSRLSRDAQFSEIRESKTDLENILGRRVPGFAYPFGTVDDYNSQSVDIARQCGFEWALSNFPGTAWHGSDRFQFPRVLVRDWDGPTFERFLEEWL